MKKETPEKSRKEEKKEAILSVSERLFAEHGFHDTSMREIARASDNNIATLYYYFKDKEELYTEILDRSFSQISTIVDDSFTMGATEEETIRVFVRSLITFLSSKKFIPRIMAWDIAQGGRFMPMVAKKYQSQNYRKLQAIIGDGVKEGRFNPVDPDLAPFSLLGMIIFFFLSPAIRDVGGIDRDDPGFAERLIDHTTRLFLDGIKARGESK